MPWLWYVGPLAVLAVYLLTGLRTRHEARRDRELDRWHGLMSPSDVERRPHRGGRDEPVGLGGPRGVTKLPGELSRMVAETGGGAPVAYFELVEKLAYVAVMGPDLMGGSEYQAVLAKLEEPAPRLTVRPLPIVDGKRVPNTGVQFKKDPAFMRQFLVEGGNAKAIGKWLTRDLRKALLELPEVWLFVQGKAMALVIYGPVDAERLEELVVVADELFALHGDDGGPSLLFDDEEGDEEDEAAESAVAVVVKAKAKAGAGKLDKGAKAAGKQAALRK